MANIKKGAPQKRVNFNLNQSLHAELKMFCAKQNKTVTEVMTEIVVFLLDREKNRERELCKSNYGSDGA